MPTSTQFMKYFFVAFLLCASVGVSVVFYQDREAEKREKTRIHEELKQAVETQKELQASLNEIQTSAAGLDQQVKSQDLHIQDLMARLSQQESLRLSAEQEIAKKISEIDELRKLIAKIEAEKKDIELRLEQQYAQYYEMRAHLEATIKSKEELEIRAKDLAENGPVSLGAVIIRQSGQ